MADTASARTVVFPYTSTQVGGSYVSSSLLVNYLQDQPDWKVRVCLPADGPNMKLFATSSFEPDNLGMKEFDSLKIRNTRIRYQLPLYAFFYLRAMTYLARHHADIVHVNDTRTLQTWGVAAKSLNIPVVWHVRAEKKNKLDAYNLRISDHLILVAESNLVRFAEFDQLPPHTTVYNAVDFNVFHPAEDPAAAKQRFGLSPERLTIGFVGNLVNRKRPEWAVQAALDLLAEGYEIQLVMIGEDYSPNREYSTRLAEMVEGAGFTNYVHFLGFRSDVPEVMRAFDVLLLSSVERGEAFPRAVIEAMSTGVAVVATRVAGVPEAITDGKTGLLAEPDSYKDFYSKIKRLVEDAAFRQCIAKQGYQEAISRFSTEHHGKQILSVYEQTAAK